MVTWKFYLLTHTFVFVYLLALIDRYMRTCILCLAEKYLNGFALIIRVGTGLGGGDSEKCGCALPHKMGVLGAGTPQHRFAGSRRSIRVSATAQVATM